MTHFRAWGRNPSKHFGCFLSNSFKKILFDISLPLGLAFRQTGVRKYVRVPKRNSRLKTSKIKRKIPDNLSNTWVDFLVKDFRSRVTSAQWLIFKNILRLFDKVEKILKGALDLIPSPSPSVKIQIMCGNVCLRYKGKILLGFVNKPLKTKRLLTSISNVLPSYIKQNFLLIF